MFTEHLLFAEYFCTFCTSIWDTGQIPKQTFSSWNLHSSKRGSSEGTRDGVSSEGRVEGRVEAGWAEASCSGSADVRKPLSHEVTVFSPYIQVLIIFFPEQGSRRWRYLFVRQAKPRAEATRNCIANHKSESLAWGAAGGEGSPGKGTWHRGLLVEEGPW